MASFIIENMDEIVAEWESFARSLSPQTARMDAWALRDHAKPMLEAIAKDIATSQTDRQQSQKSKGLGPFRGEATAAAAHGLLRQADGFDMAQLVAEFRALRATVLRLWIAHEGYGDPDSAYEMSRFNEAIDQALAESVVAYSTELAKSRDIFLAILGHDLRSPLQAMASASSILAQPASDAAQRLKASVAVSNGVSVMSAMIRDLLEFTRTRLGKGIPVAPSPANLESVCKDVINEVSHVYPKTAFRFESAGTLDGLFDSARIHQAVSNLLNNAVHHGRQDSPVLLVVSGDDDALRLQVTNQGVPIAPNQLEAVFDPLVQIPTAGSGPQPSTNLGLGLFIAREIVAAHGGSIVASSSSEAGTTFSVELPRKVARHDAPQRGAASIADRRA